MNIFNSFNPAMKKHSRQVFDNIHGTPLPHWAYITAPALIAAYIILIFA